MSVFSKIIYKGIIITGKIIENKFNTDTKNFINVNKGVLGKILKKNAETEIGKKYRFKHISSVEEYIKKVPLTDYGFYEQYIKKMISGEENILFKEKIEYFGHTSGTTGKQKLIPCNKSSRMAASKYMALLINRFAYNKFSEQWNYEKGLLIADVVMTTYTEGGIPICSATSGGIAKIRLIIPSLYTSRVEIMEIQDKETALYLHLLFALQESRLLYISGVFISNVVDMFRVLDRNINNLIKDVKYGKINKNLNIAVEVRKKLNKHLSPNVSRAEKLEKEFQKGSKNIAKRIWPALAYISTVTGADFSIYDNKLKYYIGLVPVYSPVYAATEATIGINPYVDKVEYVIIPDTVFYEFIDIDDNNQEVITTDKLKLNHKYEVVITNYAGLYRYKLGDVIRVKGFYNEAPSIEFLYRKNQLLNMVSEKTNENHLRTAIKSTVEKFNIKLVDYTTFPNNDVTPGKYIIHFEIEGNNKKIGLLNIEKYLDKEICKDNLAYGRARRIGELSQLEVILLKKNTFKKIKECLLKEGSSKNQIKIPRVIINNEKILSLLRENKVEE